MKSMRFFVVVVMCLIISPFAFANRSEPETTASIKRRDFDPDQIYAPYAGPIHVGNGGEGVLDLNGRLYVRDLYERGLHKSPYVGSDVDFQIADKDRLIKLTGSLGVTNELMLRKLNDLNDISPGLGDIVWRAIDAHSWFFVPKLVPLSKQKGLTNLSVTGVLIANRLREKIRIEKKLWSQLDEVNRLALIIHEALFSLMALDCRIDLENNIESCIQPSSKVRRLVGEAFLHPKSADPDLFDRYLALPKPNSMNCRFRNEIVVSYNGGKLYYDKVPLEEFRSFAHELCLELADLKVKRVDLQRKSFSVIPDIYLAAGRSMYNQYALSVQILSEKLELKDPRILSASNQRLCGRALFEKMRVWYKQTEAAMGEWGEGSVSLNQCE